MKELVSVVVTAYNAEQYIGEAIESIQAQTYTNWELIITDDGSNDSTFSIIKNLASEDSRIKPDSHENMGSISKCANHALKRASGRIVVRMDADDIMMPNRIEKQVKYLYEHPEITMVSCDTMFISEKGKFMGIQRMPGFDKPEDTQNAIDNLKLISCPHTGFTTYLEKILEVGGYNEQLKFCAEDLDLFTRMAEKGNTLIIIRETLMKYRMHSNSLMASITKSLIDQNAADWVLDSLIRRKKNQPELSFSEFLDQLEQQSWWKKTNRKIKFKAYNYFRLSGILYGQKKYPKALYYLLLSLLMHPSRFRKKIFTHLKHKLKFS
jgi:glycosyltransferase involved in cell wall biosynthesis